MQSSSALLVRSDGVESMRTVDLSGTDMEYLVFGVLSEDTWIHIAVTVSEDSTVAIYLNGYFSSMPAFVCAYDCLSQAWPRKSSSSPSHPVPVRH